MVTFVDIDDIQSNDNEYKQENWMLGRGRVSSMAISKVYITAGQGVFILPAVVPDEMIPVDMELPQTSHHFTSEVRHNNRTGY